MIIECTLSKSSISKAVRKLRRYAQSLEKKSERLVQILGDRGAEYAVRNYGTDHIDTGDTVNSISFTREGKIGTISVGGAAVWIEFGTGVLANEGNSPHPKRDDVGAVPWGEYGQGLGKGEWYFPSRYYGWTKTKGIHMNPFMYETAQDLRRDMLDIAKEAFKND